jgi:EAL domain-containing protein (putative c-di-GMP-specific phosphodiesterase class I)
MEVIAEGIETEQQLAELKSLKCEYGQGNLFSEPVDLTTAEKMMIGSPGLVTKLKLSSSAFGSMSG